MDGARDTKAVRDGGGVETIRSPPRAAARWPAHPRRPPGIARAVIDQPGAASSVPAH